MILYNIILYYIMDSLLNSLDSLEAETNEVQKIVDNDFQVREEMFEQMKAIIKIITFIQEKLNNLENVQDAAEDVAKLKGKIEQNNIKQGELLSKIQVLKQKLKKSPNIGELQTTLNIIKRNLEQDILNHNKFKRNAPPGNSSNNTQKQLRGTVAPTAEQLGMRVIPDPRDGEMLGGYRYSGSSPGKIISNKSRTKTKSKKKKKTRTRRRI